MTITAYRTALQLFLMASLVACERGEEATSTDSGGGEDLLTQSEFVAAYQNAWCLNLGRCCKDLQATLDPSVCSALFGNAGLVSAAATYNAVDGTQCITEMEASATCWLTPGAACNRVYSGTRAPGETCTTDLDCAQPPGGGDGGCNPLLGVCAAAVRGRLGDACQRSCRGRNGLGKAICDWGPASSPNGPTEVHCFAEDGLICGNQATCVALAGLGQPCENDNTCELSLFCRQGASTVGGTCQARGAIGFPCDGSTPCVDSAYCQAGVCNTKKAKGEHCLKGQCLGTCTCDLDACPTGEGMCTELNAILATLINRGYGEPIYLPKLAWTYCAP